MVCSLTRAAAAEVAGRDLPIDKSAIGTLHSHAYRIIEGGISGIADTPKLLSQWNEEHPEWEISGADRDLDEDNAAMGDGVGTGKGDSAYSEYNRNRARLIDRATWNQSARAFATQWERWKADNGYSDFTDLLEHALRNAPMAPGDPDVIFADECVAGDTLIAFADGRNIPIREVIEKRIEGKVWAYNHATGVVESKAITGWHSSPRRGRRFIAFGGCVVTEDHRMYTKERGYLTASEILLYNQDITFLRYSNETVQIERIINRHGEGDCCGRADGGCFDNTQPGAQRECEGRLPSLIGSTPISGMEIPGIATVDSVPNSRPCSYELQGDHIFIHNDFASGFHGVVYSDGQKRHAPPGCIALLRQPSPSSVVHGRWELSAEQSYRPFPHRGVFARRCGANCSMAISTRNFRYRKARGKGANNIYQGQWHEGINLQGERVYTSLHGVQDWRGKSAICPRYTPRLWACSSDLYRVLRGIHKNEGSANMQPELQSHQLQSAASELQSADETVYCIDVADNHNFFAGGLLVHNCQDFSALEMSLLLKWGRKAGRLIIVGDPLQALYQWRGSDPDVFFSGDAQDSRILAQSYRVPRAVHSAAMKWIRKMPGYQPIEYRPTEVEGLVAPVEATWKQVAPALELIEEKISQGQSVMYLASCSYMLQPMIAALREAGIPFHNPYRCSPPDEPVLTNQGYVPIAELNPEIHKLAGFYAENNSLSWGCHWREDGTYRHSGPLISGERRGFAFSVGCKPYEGDLITIATDRSCTRVTPNHRVRVRMSKAIQGKWLVYLMRRGNWWRVGSAKASVRADHIGGVSNRLSSEKADEAWVLGVHNTKHDALAEEFYLQAAYGITGLRFHGHQGDALLGSQLSSIHDRLAHESEGRARLLLADRKLLIEHPLYIRNGVRDRKSGCRWGFETVAANLITGYMDMPVIPENFEVMGCPRTTPDWMPMTATKEYYCGMVYSLDVPGPEHYVSGGAIVHNSKNGSWNPLARKSTGTSSVERLIAFLKMGEEGYWTRNDLATWLPTMKCSEVLPSKMSWQKFEKGPMVNIRDGEIPYELASILVGEASIEASMARDTAWFLNHLQSTRKEAASFPCAIAEKHGVSGLQELPLVTVGTIHSVKGGESDTVILCPDVSARGAETWNSGPEGKAGVYRLFYVGLTRAKQEAHIMQPQAAKLAVTLL